MYLIDTNRDGIVTSQEMRLYLGQTYGALAAAVSREPRWSTQSNRRSWLAKRGLAPALTWIRLPKPCRGWRDCGGSSLNPLHCLEPEHWTAAALT
jgi:hypothetical protein